MKRFSVVNIIGTGKDSDPWRADVSGDWVCVHAWQDRGKMLVKHIVPDGASIIASTIADVLTDIKDTTVHVDIKAVTLTTTQQSTIKTWLTNQKFDLSDFPIATSRKELLLGLLSRIGKRADCDLRLLLSGYDVACMKEVIEWPQ